MKVSFDLNYLLVFGLALCIIILIYMLIKHIFVSEKKSINSNNSGNPNEKNLSDNIDFFNTKVKIIEKSNKIVDKENNKIYQIIDMGDKILIMEETLYIPQEESKMNEKDVLNSIPLEIEKEDYQPEQINSSYENEILLSTSSDAEAMKKIIEESGQNYDEYQKDLFDFAVKDSVNVTKQVSEEEQEEEHEDDSASIKYNDSDNKFI